MSKLLLEVKNLKTHFHTDNGVVHAVDGVDFTINENETLGMVGESGCGKSVSSLSVMRLIDKPGKIVEGEILFNGENLLDKSVHEMQKIRGNDISMIFQEPMTSLNPVHTIGNQIIEALLLHQGLNRKQAMEKTIEMLKLVGIPSPESRVHDHPHQLSGGMRQRVMIAMALSCNPKLLIADEPTTALDVTIQAQILDLMRKLKDQMGSAVLMITHDLGVIAEIADNVVVLYAGEVVEYADVTTIFNNPRHPYTIALLESIPRLSDERGKKLYPIEGMIPDPLNRPSGCPFHPRCRFAQDLCKTEHPPLEVFSDGAKVRCWIHNEEHKSEFSNVELDQSAPADQKSSTVSVKENTKAVKKENEENSDILQVKNLVKYFPVKGGIFSRVINHVKAVDNISFNIHRGETFGIVGESGCGKTTTGRLSLNLLEPTSGEVIFEGQNISGLSNRKIQPLRKDMQIIFQDPFASLNPRMTVGDIIGESFEVHGLEEGDKAKDKVADLMRVVGLEPDSMLRYPHQFSGGQRQRIGIARAIALNPRLIICDEPVSALDVSIQAQIINLLEDLQSRLNLSYMFIAHDLSVVKHIADRVAVMYLGKIVELTDSEKLFTNPLHPYTEALLSAVPIPEPKANLNKVILKGDVPSPMNPPKGCRFHTRCPIAEEICSMKEPELIDKKPGHAVACHMR